MPDALKTLGQAVPASVNTAVVLYQAPTTPANPTGSNITAGRQALVSDITVANVTATDATFRLFLSSASVTTPGTANALYFDVVVSGRSSVSLNKGLAMAPGDKLWAAAGTASALTFTASGQESF